VTRRRSSVGPILVLVAVAAVPAAALGGLWRWADARASVETVDPSAWVPEVAPPTPAPPLATPLASARRLPTLTARAVNLETFRTDVVPLLDAVNDRSCVSVSVDGVEVGARQDTLPVIPASAQKLIVAAAALEVLGPDFRYRTQVVGPDAVGGTVAGDLHLVGGGDPLLSGDWYATSNLERYPVIDPTSLDTLADRVVAAGITRIEGGIVGDEGRYDTERFAPGWGAGVAGVEAGPYGALMANDSRVLGAELRADDPALAAAEEFTRMLVERGVTVVGGPSVGAAPAGAEEIASIESVPMTDVIAEMLTNSDNNTAELLVKEIGLAASGAGTREAGLAAAAEVLAGWGLDLTGVVLSDGSGLSLDNRATCDVLLTIIERDGADGPITAGLPVAATSGTLSSIFEESPVAGRLRGKTGTLNNPPFNEDPPAVKALVGSLPVEGGGAVEYALVLNGPTISDQSEYRPVWDLLATTLDTYPSGAGPDVLGPR
jgi:D-alanyl-D-alanine carboxypeptidase/D-alanyl-D-alanine-endopeptidase (penicillin-binding protein 4)